MGDSVRLVRGTAYGDAKSSCAPDFSGVRRSAAAPDLVIEQHAIMVSVTVRSPTGLDTLIKSDNF